MQGFSRGGDQSVRAMHTAGYVHFYPTQADKIEAVEIVL